MRRALLVLAVGLVVGCGADGAPSAGPGPDAGTDAGAVCGPPPGNYVEGRDPPAYCVQEVTGKLQDATSRPLSGVAVSVCGGACFGGATDPTGAFRVRVRSRLPDGAYVFFAHARPRHASILVPLPKAPPEHLDLGPFVEVPRLSEESTTLPADDAPESTVRVGPVALGVPAGTTWELAFEDATDDVEGRLLRFAKVPLDRAPPFAAGAALVYALAPFEAKASKPLSLTLSESGGLPAGSAVEIVVMGGLSLEGPNTGGLPQVVAKGHVSADAKSIATDPGQGLQLLTWIAVRASPP